MSPPSLEKRTWKPCSTVTVLFAKLYINCSGPIYVKTTVSCEVVEPFAAFEYWSCG